MYRLRILLVPLLAGYILYAISHANWISSVEAIASLFALWGIDLFTLPFQGKLAYRYGLLPWAAWTYASSVALTFSRLTRLQRAAEVAWILQDLDRHEQAAFWLARYGDGAIERDPWYGAALARYLARVQTKVSLAMDLADAALQSANLARAHYVRGLCYLNVQEFHSAIASFENARKLAVATTDSVLTGFCYLRMGEAWNRLGEREYAHDHLLRAEIMLSFLPQAMQQARNLKAGDPGIGQNA